MKPGLYYDVHTSELCMKYPSGEWWITHDGINWKRAIFQDAWEKVALKGGLTFWGEL